MTAGRKVMDLALESLRWAEEDLENHGIAKDMVGYLMSRCLALESTSWARGAAKALEAWADAQDQYREAKRVASWNPETGWKKPAVTP